MIYSCQRPREANPNFLFKLVQVIFKIFLPSVSRSATNKSDYVSKVEDL